MTNPLGLSKEALAQRRQYVCAGDVAPIMAGQWREVWQEKKGLLAPDLDGVLPVQMGSYTEPFNLYWYIKQTGRPVEYYSGNSLMQMIWCGLTGHHAVEQELIVSKRYPWMACNLDALSTTSKGHRCVLDAKHVGRLDEATVLRYTPAGVHQAIVCGVDWWALSCFIGNSKWEVVEQEVDPFYVEDVIATTREFWDWVERDEEPRDRAEPTLPPKPEKRLRNIDLGDEFGTPAWAAMVAKHNWAAEAHERIVTFTATEGAAKAHAISREELKALVPDDIGELRRGRFVLTRNRAGSVTMKLEAPQGGK